MLKGYKKYFILITYTMLLGFMLLNIKDIINFISNTLTILSPLWIGIGLAFTLNVPMSILEREVFGKSNKKTRIISLILSIMIILCVVLVLFVWVIPDFIDSATYLLGQTPKMIEGFNNILVSTFKNTDLSSYLKNFTGSTEITAMISNIFKSLINNFSGILSNLATFLVNLFTGIIIAIYFLLEKEKIIKLLKELIEKIFDDKTEKKVNEVLTLSNKCFHDFITYQCLECLILGVMMFIIFVIFGFPYALTIAFLTAITAIIPVFGATIACVIGAILIGTASIKEAVIFVIVFLIVQQIEGNVIYPKVVGKHVGLPAIITIIAIIIGGKIGGFVGMLICIPITTIIYSLLCTNIKEKEEEKKKKNKIKEV